MNGEKFSLSKVLKIKKQNENREQDIIDHHYCRVVYKIKNAYKNYKEGCYYDVDLFVSKLPMYDANVIAEKLVDFMKKKGFQCKIVYQNRLFCWWKKKERKKDHLPLLLEDVQRRIERYAKENSDYCFYEIPIFLSGCPWYDAVEAAVLIARKLSNKGFIVKVIDQSRWLYVSWKKDEIENKSRVKIKFETEEEKRMKALEKIQFINEQRYVDFVNPKTSKINKIKSKKSNVSISEPKPVSVKPRFERFDNEFLRGLSNLKNDVSKYTLR